MYLEEGVDNMIRIVTDSTADLTPEQLAAAQIEMIPLNVILEGETYADGVDLSKDQLYAKIRAARELPTTSQASPQAFADRFRTILEAGDDVLYIGLSSTLSGTVQSARIGRDLLEADEQARVTIIDSLTVTYGQGMLVLEAAKLVEQGLSVQEIEQQILSLRARQKLLLYVSTLENLRKSGRVSNLSFLFGSLLNIKPILFYDNDGVVQVYDRVRGTKNADLTAVRFVTEHRPDPNYPIAVGSVDDPQIAEHMRELLRGAGFSHLHPFDVSVVVGAHVGLSAIGIVFIAAE